ncbi:histidine kinase [Humibacillus sp. DSM 29435]|uniref:sensor histidine kinase n=1 Tax=Humibacillus sp. DSM 29435 TaxID=1869167 RepID=UPI0008723172|nr:histidine kinase [Humibacillus sp. DSM 29435]OFE15278.1 histidine kinase [Humibacillus sp. DSM 29435]
MSTGSRQRFERVQSWFGADTDWERRPSDSARTLRVDLLIAGVLLVSGLLGIEVLRSLDNLGKLPGPVWLPHLAVVVGTVPLVWRRRYPIAVMAGLSLHFLVVGLTLPIVASSFAMQVVYFFAIFTGVAWARNRQAMLLVAGGVVVVMFAWLTWQYAVGSGLESVLSDNGKPLPVQGLFSPLTAYVVYSLIINVFYFGGAVVGGQAAWRAALHRAHLAEQAATIEAQTLDLQRQAVVEERLRIARELHDVVAHHVSVIGIQAAAARRVMGRDVATAEKSLRSIESSSRDAVTQMRGLLGTLRSGDAAEREPRAPEPTLSDVPTLVGETESPGLHAQIRVVEDRPGAVESVPSPIGLSLYRTVQEALANVRRHSTASSATVFVRVDRRGESGFRHGYAEVEVIDTGRPRAGTSGTGLGLLGVRERLATHGGVSEIGPRATGGYRVRVRMPLPEEPS